MVNSYTATKYGKITQSFAFLIIITVAAIAYAILGQYKDFFDFDLGQASTLTTFMYGFFAFSFLSYIQTKFFSFKSTMGDFFSEVKGFYLTLKLTGQEAPIQKGRETLIKMLQSIQNKPMDDFLIEDKYKAMLYECAGLIEADNTKNANYHFSLLLRITSLANTIEKIHIFCRKYLAGELKMIFFAFTALFIAVIGTLAIHNTVSLLVGVVLITIIIFSVFYLIHLDEFSLSETVLVQNKIQQTIDFLNETDAS